ncbi:MAG TPA: 50S ribosomal protein L24 [Candidatus Pacearchaeota archaeon]|nr:50S ribosomal protein L24 [Candidatus Pacearchaeota archaeon]
MKKKFSTKWKGSTKPRKQRKYSANAPLHLKKKLVASNLSKELRKKHGTRSISLRKGDTVKIMRGKFKGKSGKISSVKIKLQKIEVEGIQTKKMDNSKVNVPLKASNVQIVELNFEDRKRGKNLKKLEKDEIKRPEETGEKK